MKGRRWGAVFHVAVNDRDDWFVRDPIYRLLFLVMATVPAAPKRVLSLILWFNLPFSAPVRLAGQIVVSSNLPLKSISATICLLHRVRCKDWSSTLFMRTEISSYARLTLASQRPRNRRGCGGARIERRTAVQRPIVVAQRETYAPEDLIRPVNKVLIHARGCTAAADSYRAAAKY